MIRCTLCKTIAPDEIQGQSDWVVAPVAGKPYTLKLYCPECYRAGKIKTGPARKPDETKEAEYAQS